MIELKKEYTILLCHILTPIILEGLQHLYNESKNNSNKNNILKTFQLLLKSIPTWDIDIIKKEVDRILMKTKEQSWLIQLIQVIFRLNIMINNLEPTEVMKKELDMGQFIHAIYIECARQFWMDPFLFYHEYSSFEQKRNYCEIMKIIGCCIENAIRRVLPIKSILEKFLGESIKNKELDLLELYNMPLILDMPIELEKPEKPSVMEPLGGGDNNILLGGGEQIQQILPVVNNMMQPNMMQSNMMQSNMMQSNMMQPNMMQPNMMQSNMIGGVETNENNINEKILNIINKNNVLTESNDNNNFTVNNHSANNMQPNIMMQPNGNNMQPNMIMQSNGNNMQANMMIQNKHHSDKKSSSTLKRIIQESIRQNHNTATKTNSNNSSEIKNKILKDLDSDTANYNPEVNVENYQDIFSNSDMKHTINTNEKVEKKSREKFFNNYLNI